MVPCTVLDLSRCAQASTATQAGGFRLTACDARSDCACCQVRADRSCIEDIRVMQLLSVERLFEDDVSRREGGGGPHHHSRG